MKKVETQSEEARVITGGLPPLFKVLSKPDALKLFHRTVDGIKNSTYAIEELDLTPKKYYARLSELVAVGLVKKVDSVYGQTGLGRMVYDRLLPAFGKAVNAKDELEFLAGLEGLEMENGVRNRILEELGIPIFADSKVKLLGDYEALAIEAIDLYDSAEENVILATNYLDVRVMEAFLRAVGRGATNRVIMGKNSRSSKIQNLRTMLSVTFTKELINFASNTEDLKDVVRFAELPYTFCVVDGQRSILEFSNTLKDSFIAALSIDDWGVGEKLTDFYEMLWKTGEAHSTFKVLDSLKSS